MKTMILATAALLSMQFTIQATPARAQISSDPVLAVADGALIFGWATHATMGAAAHVTFATKSLFEQRRAVLVELGKIPATRQVVDLTDKMKRVDVKIEGIVNDMNISRAEAIKQVQSLSEIKSEFSLERTKALKSALSQVPSELLLMTDESLLALQSSHVKKSEALSKQIRQLETRLVMRRHFPIVLGGAIIFVTAHIRGESPSEMLVNAIGSLSLSATNALADNLVADLKAEEAE